MSAEPILLEEVFKQIMPRQNVSQPIHYLYNDDINCQLRRWYGILEIINGYDRRREKSIFRIYLRKAELTYTLKKI